MSVPTPHIGAKMGEIAKVVLMPGDPLRAKFIAEKYLTEVHQYNEVRGMLGFTGTYKGKQVSVQGSGMGMPSMGIYSYELFNFYGVEKIIRIGSAGAIQPELNLGDLVIGLSASTDSNYAGSFQLPGTIAPTAAFSLVEKAVAAARAKQVPVRVGNILASDVFYGEGGLANMEKWKMMGVLCVEMESVALYLNAVRAGKEALCMLSISDKVFGGEAMSAQERQTSFTNMMEVALETATA